MRYRHLTRLQGIGLLLGLLGLTTAACGGVPGTGVAAAGAPAQLQAVAAPVSDPAGSYVPQTRSFVITTVPLAVHEMQGAMDYLKKDFAKGGLLEGKEVYGFYPSTLTVYAGDTLDLTLVNPEDDPHTFTIGELNLNVNMPPQASVKTTVTVRTPGIYTFLCAEAEHAPYMWGQLVVLPDRDAS